MNRLRLLSLDESMHACKGDIVVDADSRSLHIKINEGSCNCSPPSPYSSSTYNCCWVTLKHIDMLMQLEARLKSGGVSLLEHPQINDLNRRSIDQRISIDMLGSHTDHIYEELCMLKQQCKEQKELLQRLMPTKVAIVEDGERKLQLQHQQQ